MTETDLVNLSQTESIGNVELAESGGKLSTQSWKERGQLFFPGSGSSSRY